MQISTLPLRALSMIGGLALIGIGAHLNTAEVGTLEGFFSPPCLFVYGLAGGTALVAYLIPGLWDGRRALGLLLVLGVVSGEAFGFITTAERLLAARDERVGRLVRSNEPRLLALEAKKRAMDELALAQAKAAAARDDKRCGDVCRAWEAKEAQARERFTAAEAALSATRPIRPESPLAKAFGISATVADIVPALLGSAALLILGFGLIAFGHDLKRDRVERQRHRRARSLAWIRAYTKKHGHPPSFSVVRDELELPNATAHRYRKKAVG